MYSRYQGILFSKRFDPGFLYFANRQAEWIVFYCYRYCLAGSDLLWKGLDCLSCDHYFVATLFDYSSRHNTRKDFSHLTLSPNLV